MNNSFNVNPDGSVLMAQGKVFIQDDGTVIAPKFRINPDGSLLLGEALSIDENGVMTLNGGEFRIQSGYNLIFTDGGSPVISSPNGTKFKLLVDDSGNVTTTPL